jgi:protein-tyrosine phosphatase
MPDLYWIELAAPGRLAIMARPRAGEWLDDEVTRWQQAGVKTVVSLLESAEVSELGLQRESTACCEREMEFISFPIPDRCVPVSRADAAKLAAVVAERVQSGAAVAIHCRAGIGRSALMAAYVLKLLGVTPSEAFERIGNARGVVVPDTDEQREWLHKDG